MSILTETLSPSIGVPLCSEMQLADSTDTLARGLAPLTTQHVFNYHTTTATLGQAIQQLRLGLFVDRENHPETYRHGHKERCQINLPAGNEATLRTPSFQQGVKERSQLLDHGRRLEIAH